MNVVFAYSKMLPLTFLLEALSNLSPVACCLAFSSILPPEPRSQSSSETCQPIVAESFQQYRSSPWAAHSCKSSKNLQQPSPSAGVHLNAISNSSVLGNRPMLLLEKLSHPYFLPLVECTKIGLPHPFGKLLQGEFRLHRADWGLPSAPSQSAESSLSYSTSKSSVEISVNGAKSAIPGSSDLRGSAAGRNRFVGRLMRGFPRAPGSCPYGVEAQEVSRMT
jgi:hypothetical protein